MQRQRLEHILSSVIDKLLLQGLEGKKGVSLGEESSCSGVEQTLCTEMVLGLLPYISSEKYLS